MKRIIPVFLLSQFLFQFSCLAQEVTVYKFYYDRSEVKGGNHFVNGTDTIRTAKSILDPENTDRSIYKQGEVYTFKRNKNTKKTELLSEGGKVLAVCEGPRKKFFNITDSQGHTYVLQKQGGKKWSYWVDSKKVLDGKFMAGELGKRVEITIVDASNPSVELASLMSFAYTSEIIRNRKNLPLIIGAAALLGVVRAVMTSDSTPNPQ